MRRMFASLLLGLLLALVPGRGARAEAELDVLETAHYRLEYPPNLAGLAQRLVDQIETWHGRIYGELGADAKGQTIVTLMPDERDMFSAVARRHPGSRPPEWAAGLAFPGHRTIFLRADVPAEELLTTAQHEISHVALGSLAGPGRAPIWFSEGLAIRQSEPVAFERIWLLTEAALVDRLLPLSALDGAYPPGGGRIGVGYAQSVHFVGFLATRYGEARFKAFIRALGTRPEPFEAVLAEVYGRSLSTLEAEWREGLTFWWGWIPIVVVGTSFWVLIGALLVFAWRRRRREQARRMRDLAGLEVADMAEDVEIAHDLRPPRDMHDPYQGRPPSIH
ncbi:hypothetical protein L6V77_01570 [Myxococcota bacterium]|nr:hypothetical protein [Myxococcota bacterium]